MKFAYRPSKLFIGFILFVLFCFATAIRIQYLASTEVISPIRADAAQYTRYAINLALNGSFSVENPAQTPVTPDSFRSPGYPLFMSLFVLLKGEQYFYWPLILSQILLGGLMPLLTYMIAIRFLPFLWAVIGAILVTISPHLISISIYCLTESISGVALLAVIWMLSLAAKRKSLFCFFLAALACGYAYLINETFLFLPYLFAGAVIIRYAKKRCRSAWRPIFLFVAIFSLFPITWHIRNHVNVPREALKDTTRAISAMSHGAYPDFMHTSEANRYYMHREDPRQPEFGSSLSSFFSILAERTLEQPLKYLTWYLIKKPVYLWKWDIAQGQGDIHIYPTPKSLYTASPLAEISRQSMRVLHPLFIILAFLSLPLAGLQFYRGNQDGDIQIAAAFVLITFAYYTLLHVVFVPWPRYSIPLRPMLYLCGLFSIDRLIGLGLNHFGSSG